MKTILSKPNMYDKEALDKKNFLSWYEMADVEDLKTADRIKPGKLRELLEKYKPEVREIDKNTCVT